MEDSTAAIALTNNPGIKCREPRINVIYLDVSVFEVMQEAQKLILGGYRLLTHPLAGNWQMNRTPYKTMLLKKTAKADGDSIAMLGKCLSWIRTMPQSQQRPAAWPAKTLTHYQLIDQDIFEHAVSCYRTAPNTY